MADVTVGVVVETGARANFDDDAPVSQWPVAISASPDDRGYALGFPSGRIVNYYFVHGLGSGSQGGVQLIADPDSGGAFAIKRFNSEKDAEKELVWVGNPDVELSMVPAVALTLESTGEPVVLMRVGTPLNDAYSEIPRDSPDRLVVAEAVAAAVEDLERMLIDMGAVYTDVTPKNLLVVPVPDRPTAVRIMFMDYGGLCSIGYDGHCPLPIGFIPPETWKRAARGYNFNTEQATDASRFWGAKVGDYLLGDVEPSDRLRRHLSAEPERRFAVTPAKRPRHG